MYYMLGLQKQNYSSIWGRTEKQNEKRVYVGEDG